MEPRHKIHALFSTAHARYTYDEKTPPTSSGMESSGEGEVFWSFPDWQVDTDALPAGISPKMTMLCPRTGHDLCSGLH